MMIFLSLKHLARQGYGMKIACFDLTLGNLRGRWDVVVVVIEEHLIYIYTNTR